MIELDAGLDSLLDWKMPSQINQNPLFWYLNFGFSKELPSYFLNAPLSSYRIAVSTFIETCLKQYEDQTKGVYLFRGSLSNALSMRWDVDVEDDFLKWKQGFNKMKHLRDYYAMLSFSNYLHTLSAPIPETVKVLISFDISGFCSPSRTAQLLSHEHFSDIDIEITGSLLPIRVMDKTEKHSPSLGLVFPKLIKSSEAVLDVIDALIETLQNNGVFFKLIPESHLTEQWGGLDHLIILSETLTSEGLRKVMGFSAAGGVTVILGEMLCIPDEMSLQAFLSEIGVEGFEPPTYCSQSSRASQAALYPEE